MTTHEPGAPAWRKSSFSGDGGCVEVGWRKSSFSNGGDACVEVGWRKSSFSNGEAACVEIAPRLSGVAVRDSKQQAGPTLGFPTSDWRAFLTTL